MKYFVPIIFSLLLSIVLGVDNNVDFLDGAKFSEVRAKGSAVQVQAIETTIRGRVGTAQQISGDKRGSTASAAAASPLLTSLVGYWKLDEASGTRADSSGSNNLTDNNTVTQGAGKVGNSAQFTRANQENLTIDDNAALSMNATHSCTIAGWFLLDSDSAATPVAVGKIHPGVVQWEYAIFYNGGTDNIGFSSSPTAGAGGNNLLATSFGTVTTATWYFVVAGFDHTTDVQYISINGGTVDTFSLVDGINDDTAPFTIGSFSTPTMESDFWDGRIDEVGVWKRRLTANEITQLYNSGNGVTYPTFAIKDLPKWIKLVAGKFKTKKHHRDINYFVL